YRYKIEQLKADGAPVDWFTFDPEIARIDGAGIAKAAPHPAAALLFLDFLLSDGQTILFKRNYTPANVKMYPLKRDANVVLIDPARRIDETKKWQGLFDEIVLDAPH